VNVATADDMRALGRALGNALRTAGGGALVIGIEGELGAGKTTLVAGVLASLGVAGAIRSPTYTLIEPYDAAGLQLYHIDLYRLSEPRELGALGLRDFALPWHLWLIEWPERGTNVLPAPDLRIALRVTAEGHPVEASAHSPLGCAWLAAAVAADLHDGAGPG